MIVFLFPFLSISLSAWSPHCHASSLLVSLMGIFFSLCQSPILDGTSATTLSLFFSFMAILFCQTCLFTTTLTHVHCLFFGQLPYLDGILVAPRLDYITSYWILFSQRRPHRITILITPDPHWMKSSLHHLSLQHLPLYHLSLYQTPSHIVNHLRSLDRVALRTVPTPLLPIHKL